MCSYIKNLRSACFLYKHIMLNSPPAFPLAPCIVSYIRQAAAAHSLRSVLPLLPVAYLPALPAAPALRAGWPRFAPRAFVACISGVAGACCGTGCASTSCRLATFARCARWFKGWYYPAGGFRFSVSLGRHTAFSWCCR